MRDNYFSIVPGVQENYGVLTLGSLREIFFCEGQGKVQSFDHQFVPRGWAHSRALKAEKSYPPSFVVTNDWRIIHVYAYIFFQGFAEFKLDYVLLR